MISKFPGGASVNEEAIRFLWSALDKQESISWRNSPLTQREKSKPSELGCAHIKKKHENTHKRKTKVKFQLIEKSMLITETYVLPNNTSLILSTVQFIAHTNQLLAITNLRNKC